ncbi:10896_t:CDS:1, partial [Gigaspora rosea]
KKPLPEWKDQLLYKAYLITIRKYQSEAYALFTAYGIESIYHATSLTLRMLDQINATNFSFILGG